ncbi:phosphatidate phosphatase PAH1 [Vigna radiata var. radiata]|uniref:phosphatidate phosphatase n=1 Tax=Vigna radiata var. radiata TaxID=3916 RepID=A0A1S3TQR6_VIGRR|nr:phosphatidate phosphatase PAH1 [Vigna radiata var. radiata]XP_022634896.1 phosphatidate phosphatase PAH1 [Vigna radiata var. radiata]
MNVVGKVGSLITQGVYSVATPFHPFGGAVDVIVVQQQDGTFRCTPWYVRFGKFQGVLKGAEKVVRINVNGVESHFHMYLDNSGEAYFVKEVDDDGGDNGIKSNGTAGNSECSQEDDGVEIDEKNNSYLSIDGRVGHRFDHSISDSGVRYLTGEGHSSVLSQLQRAESDVDRRFYEFPDDQPSFEGSLDVSEYDSTRYENLDVDNFMDSQGSHPEVVLVSVDGHVLTAPISESEQNEDNVQLKNPQFHLGPGEGTDFYEGNGELISDENAWTADYVSPLDASSSYDTKVADDTSGLLLEAQGQGEINCHTEESLVIKNQENHLLQTDSEEAVSCMKRESVFKSCLELREFTQQAGNDDLQDLDSSLGVQNSAEESNANISITDENKDENIQVDIQDVDSSLEVRNISEKLIANGSITDENKQENIDQCRKSDRLSPLSVPSSFDDHSSPELEVEPQVVDRDASVKVDTGSGSHYGAKDVIECNDERVGESVSNDHVDDSEQTPALEDGNKKSELTEPQIVTSIDEDQCHSALRFEASLCGHELKVGMGLVAAAEVFEAHRISAEEFRSSASSIIKNENLVLKFRESYLRWEKAAPLVLGKTIFGLDLPVDPKDTIPVRQDDTVKATDEVSGPASSGRRWRLWPIPFRRVKTIEHTDSESNEDVFVDSESDWQTSTVEPSPTSARNESPRKQFVRTNVPSNEMIASLNLKDGQNLVTFSFSSRVLGKQQVDAHIYLWKWNARIVISDVDGTITKSDVLGQVMPLVGRDWTQSGVARLFSAIKENGYQLLFLSARAIVQAYLTRNFLVNLKQDGKNLPNGPVVISPDGLFPSLYREVIRRAPHEFKIACLEDIKRLFPSDYNPFYAGFGNRDTDELSYRKMGIPKGKIFIINPKGEVATSHRIDSKSYTSLHTLVNDMFPPTSLVEQEDFNSWNYWRMPFPEVD